MTNLETIVKFIKDNNLEFTGNGSELNGNCVILAGFICYILDASELDSSDGQELINDLYNIIDLGFSIDANAELLRVFDFAYESSYEKFWKTTSAKEQYIF